MSPDTLRQSHQDTQFSLKQELADHNTAEAKRPSFEELNELARLTEEQTNEFVDAVLGKDSNGNQLQDNFRPWDTPDGSYDVGRTHNPNLNTTTVSIDFTPKDAHNPTIFFSMHAGADGMTPSFNLITLDPRNPDELPEPTIFDVNFTGLQEKESLVRCANFIAQAKELLNHAQQASDTL